MSSLIQLLRRLVGEPRLVSQVEADLKKLNSELSEIELARREQACAYEAMACAARLEAERAHRLASGQLPLPITTS